MKQEIRGFNGRHRNLKFRFHGGDNPSCQGGIFAVLKNGDNLFVRFVRLALGNAFDGNCDVNDQSDFSRVRKLADLFSSSFLSTS